MAATVNTQHDDYKSMKEKWQRCRDTVSGSDAIHNAGETYLPKLTNQTTDEYYAYKMRAEFFNCVWRTISALSGMLFRKEPIIESDDSVKNYLDDVDLSGTNFTIFAQQIAIDVLTTGRIGILVDYPNQSVEGMTEADAARLNLRPIMKQYKAESIINWRMARINNVYKLVLLVLVEDKTIISDDGFEEKHETIYRVLDLDNNQYRVRVFKLNDKGENEQIEDDLYPLMNNQRLDYIPFYFVGIDDTTAKIDEPPLIDLVNMNLTHYRLDADHKHGLHFTALPTAVVSGYVKPSNEGALCIGSQTAWIFPEPTASATYLEFSGQGLKAIADEKSKCEERMAVIGARMLMVEKKDAETAQTAQIHRSSENSVLALIAGTLSISLTNALQTFAKWSGSNNDASVEINKEFMPPNVTPQELSAWLQAWIQGAPGFSDEGFFDLLQKKEFISSDVTLEDEQARIANRPPKLIGM